MSGLMGSFASSRKPKYGFTTKMNLVSLMDIFTILVFFLLLNAGDSKNLEKAHFIKLPESSAKYATGGDLVVMLNKESIRMGDNIIAETDVLEENTTAAIEELLEVLDEISAESPEATEFEAEHGRPITLMADKSVPYSLLKRVMATCVKADFRDISLAVNQSVRSADQILMQHGVL